MTPNTLAFPSARSSGVTALVVEAGYFLTNALLWLYGFLAYYRNFGGIVRFLGALYLPILALPVVGRGGIGGHDVRSVLWVAWFALEVGLGLAVVLIHMSATAEGETGTFGSRSSTSSPTAPAAPSAASGSR